jgi:hypothetical protein
MFSHVAKQRDNGTGMLDGQKPGEYGETRSEARFGASTNVFAPGDPRSACANFPLKPLIASSKQVVQCMHCPLYYNHGAICCAPRTMICNRDPKTMQYVRCVSVDTD